MRIGIILSEIEVSAGAAAEEGFKHPIALRFVTTKPSGDAGSRKQF